MAGCMQAAVDLFFDTYIDVTLKQKTYEVEKISGEMVFLSFSRTAESAGAVDGWGPKEMSLLSRQVCDNIAIMLNQIEERAPWQRLSLHARVV